MERSSWSGSESPGEDMDRLSDSGGDKTMDGDPEGVWSPDIEQSFQEALAIYPPCGRRKIILSDEGKMYGRNELIARYIKLRTGKTRTRKQVSSHIQVLARRKSREFQSKLKDQNAKEKALQSISSMSSAQIVSATAIHSKLLPGIVRASFPANAQLWQGMIPGGQSSSTTEDIKPFSQQAYSVQTAGTTTISGYEPPSAAQTHREPAWQGRSIGTTKLRLVEFSSFLETQRDQEAYNKHLFVHISQSSLSYSDPLLECVDIRQIYDKFPEKKGGLKELFDKGPQNAFYLIKFWADLNYNVQDDPAAFYGVTSQYESSENMTITCSTKNQSFPDVRIHDQLHPQAQTPAGEIHDEQRAGELHYFAGGEQQRHSGNVAVYGVCVRGVQQRAWSTAPHLPTHQGITHTHIHTHVETHVWPLLGVFFFFFPFL
ncbi:transcriptional enhancer factor TEF-1a isoform X1 [Oreochromis aureus]|uniref:TEA domain-containing protein n=1 Tax=Oreochromis aureus TaxID=47969 RepID=A0A668RQ55_OREAU|nr:transcriptional enhancer factor TEF-1a isoform X1 [Oreochromis aureus]XP_039470782.1 transcriptional enhancer factor TEF-1a isoform X1 [Oreochromis aureus]